MSSHRLCCCGEPGAFISWGPESTFNSIDENYDESCSPFCLCDEDIIHPEVKAEKYFISNEYVDGEGMVRVGYELFVHPATEYKEVTENDDCNEDCYQPNEDGEPLPPASPPSALLGGGGFSGFLPAGDTSVNCPSFKCPGGLGGNSISIEPNGCDSGSNPPPYYSKFSQEQLKDFIRATGCDSDCMKDDVCCGCGKPAQNAGDEDSGTKERDVDCPNANNGEPVPCGDCFAGLPYPEGPGGFEGAPISKGGCIRGMIPYNASEYDIGVRPYCGFESNDYYLGPFSEVPRRLPTTYSVCYRCRNDPNKIYEHGDRYPCIEGPQIDAAGCLVNLNWDAHPGEFDAIYRTAPASEGGQSCRDLNDGVPSTFDWVGSVKYFGPPRSDDLYPDLPYPCSSKGNKLTSYWAYRTTGGLETTFCPCNLLPDQPVPPPELGRCCRQCEEDEDKYYNVNGVDDDGNQILVPQDECEGPNDSWYGPFDDTDPVCDGCPPPPEKDGQCCGLCDYNDPDEGEVYGIDLGITREDECNEDNQQWSECQELGCTGDNDPQGCPECPEEPEFGRCCIGCDENGENCTDCIDEVTQEECDEQDGDFEEGDCESNPCPEPDPVGRCCLDCNEQGKNCRECEEEKTEQECNELNGIYGGDGSTCEDNPCPCEKCCGTCASAASSGNAVEPLSECDGPEGGGGCDKNEPCPQKPPQCYDLEFDYLQVTYDIECVERGVCVGGGDGEDNCLLATNEEASPTVNYMFNKLIERFGPQRLPSGRINPYPGNIWFNVYPDKWEDFVEGQVAQLYEKFRSEYDDEVAEYKFNPCFGTRHCVGTGCKRNCFANLCVNPTAGGFSFQYPWVFNQQTLPVPSQDCYMSALIYNLEYHFEDGYHCDEEKEENCGKVCNPYPVNC